MNSFMKENISTSNKGLRFIANGISVLLHPVFMPVICCIVIYAAMPELFIGVKPKVLTGWVGMIVINTIVFPVLLMLLLKGLGFIKSIYLKDVKERVIPLIGIMVFYFWAYWVVKNVGVPIAKSDLTTLAVKADGPQVPALVRMLLLGNFWGIIAVFLVTIFFKISMHTAGVGSLLGLVLVMMIVSKSFLLLPFIIAGAAALLIGLARYSLGAHSSKQLIAGYVVGIAAQFGAYWYI
jgi:membrane-associated phospholipid phosphatase